MRCRARRRGATWHVWCSLGSAHVHLGTHLGHGGRVEGNTLVCPYHEWAFDASGKNQCIPYCKRGGPKGMVGVERVNAQAYTTEMLAGMLFVWYHADNAPPQYALSLHRDFGAAVDAGQPGRSRVCGGLRRWLSGWWGGWYACGSGEFADMLMVSVSSQPPRQ